MYVFLIPKTTSFPIGLPKMIPGLLMSVRRILPIKGLPNHILLRESYTCTSVSMLYISNIVSIDEII